MGGRVALALRVGLREGGKCLSFWIAGRPGRNSYRRASREGAFLLEREESPGPFAPGGAPSQTRPGPKDGLGRVSIGKRSARISCPGEFRSELGNSFPSFGREKIVTWLILPVVICL